MISHAHFWSIGLMTDIPIDPMQCVGANTSIPILFWSHFHNIWMCFLHSKNSPEKNGIIKLYDKKNSEYMKFGPLKWGFNLIYYLYLRRTTHVAWFKYYYNWIEFLLYVFSFIWNHIYAEIKKNMASVFNTIIYYIHKWNNLSICRNIYIYCMVLIKMLCKNTF